MTKLDSALDSLASLGRLVGTTRGLMRMLASAVRSGRTAVQAAHVVRLSDCSRVHMLHAHMPRHVLGGECRDANECQGLSQTFFGDEGCRHIRVGGGGRNFNTRCRDRVSGYVLLLYNEYATVPNLSVDIRRAFCC
jgi:hypothetical protein